MASSRWYQWEAVVWPENLSSLDVIINDFGVKGFLSPLHSMDGGKSHYHWIMCFDSAKTYVQVMDMLRESGLHSLDPDDDEHSAVNTVRYVKDLTTRARYLCHLDSPNKFHYATEDVICIGGMSYSQFLDFVSDKVQNDLSLIGLIDKYQLRSYAQLVKYCLYVDKESYRSVVGRCGFWSAYLRSLREDPTNFEIQNIIDERTSKNA